MTKEALKLALEALENLFGIPDKWTGEGGGDVAVWRLGGSYRAQQAITAIKEALAQPEQEPVAAVAWQQGYDQGVADERISEANIGIAGFGAKVNPSRNNPYTSPQPPQRTWVGLSDEEIKALVSWWPSYDQMPALMVLVKDIQNSLKEKNT